jgi:cytochrome c oxidase cbb3-type subunit I/II
MQERLITYDDRITRWFIWASVVFGLVGMLAGVYAAAEMVFHQLGFGLPYLAFGRLRPLHTNAVIFAFVGNMMFAGVYYSTQRLLKARMASDLLGQVHFWGWQLIIVAAAVTLPLGLTQGKEYAELIWPIDVAIAVVWVVFAVNFFWTLARRNEKNLYVALWFYIATIITVAILHVVNSLALPFAPLESYPVYAGVQDALVQWWYGHNAVAFFLTTPILGIMYYFLPKAAERPVYSYRLSIVHFWSLVFLYIWAGPHHLLNTALPDWAQTLGMVFSLMLWAPSWGGMLNGLLTLRGVWDKLRSDPVLKFFAAGVTFYGMSTFEGPLLSIKSVNALAHYTDWIIGHVHAGALGWNGLMAAGMFYWLVPRLYGTRLHSSRAADVHFWIATIGILLYMVSMYVSGLTQGLMWRAFEAAGGLKYGDFVETLNAIRPMYLVRLLGGTLYFGGFALMAWNLVRTARAGAPAEVQVTVAVDDSDAEAAAPLTARALATHPSMVFVVVIGALSLLYFLAGPVTAALVLAALVGLVGAAYVYSAGQGVGLAATLHRRLERHGLFFTLLVLVCVLVGGVAELVPTIAIRDAAPEMHAADVTQPYRPLELLGRDVYVREGCYVCHSQMIRPFHAEKLRYGDPSTLGDSRWDRPFQWGSKRTGPDLARVGGKYPDLWHYEHMKDPRSISPGSNMPSYPWLFERRADLDSVQARLTAMRRLGVPYDAATVSGARDEARRHAERLAAGLAQQGAQVPWDREVVALIAYLQRLGRRVSPAEAGGPVAATTPVVQP